MKRNIMKTIEDYNDLKARTGKCFGIEDFRQIYDNIQKAEGQVSAFNLIWDSLSVGFMVGYRTAQTDAKRK